MIRSIRIVFIKKFSKTIPYDSNDSSNNKVTFGPKLTVQYLKPDKMSNIQFYVLEMCFLNVLTRTVSHINIPMYVHVSTLVWPKMKQSSIRARALPVNQIKKNA